MPSPDWLHRMASHLKLTKKKKYCKNEKTFIRNGRRLFEELIASCDGKCNPIRMFSAEELKKATDNYDDAKIIRRHSVYVLYQGVIEGRSVTVKKYVDLVGDEQIGEPFTDIIIGSQMSSHHNVLKLLGCCLETENPILVHEFASKKTLKDYISSTDGMDSQPLPILPWKCRVKAAMSIANAVAYLHSALSRPVVHRDINPSIILMDENYAPKLCDFSISVPIPEGESHVKTSVKGKYGFLAPESLSTGLFSEKSDVYGFGVLLFMLLTGQAKSTFRCEGGRDLMVNHVRECIGKNRFEEIVDPIVMGEGLSPSKEQQLQAFTSLAIRCIDPSAEDRPTMVDVGKELTRIYRS